MSCETNQGVNHLAFTKHSKFHRPQSGRGRENPPAEQPSAQLKSDNCRFWSFFLAKPTTAASQGEGSKSKIMQDGR